MQERRERERERGGKRRKRRKEKKEVKYLSIRNSLPKLSENSSDIYLSPYLSPYAYEIIVKEQQRYSHGWAFKKGGGLFILLDNNTYKICYTNIHGNKILYMIQNTMIKITNNNINMNMSEYEYEYKYSVNGIEIV